MTTPSNPSLWRGKARECLRRLRCVAAAVLALRMLAPMTAAAVPFTYQGRLVDGSALGNGSYELTFRLFDSVSGGSQVGGSVVVPSVTVTNGLFTVELDFGGAAFPGAPRWLELGARVAGDSNPAETLSPRQAILAVPYAMRAFAGSGNASELSSGTVPDERLSLNIARAAALTTLSNTLAARISALEVALDTISNQVRTLPPSTVAAVSSSASDPALLGAGWTSFSSVPAPNWASGNASGPSGRSGHSAVWTGQSWLIWGGNIGSGNLTLSGRAYDPVGDA